MDEDLLHEVKRVAAEERTTLTALLEEALRELLARRRQGSPRGGVPLPSYEGRGLQPGVDLDDTATLLDLMDRRDAPG